MPIPSRYALFRFARLLPRYHADPTNGLRRVSAMGNLQHGLTAELEFADLPAGNYYWSVQAVDNAFAGSPFAPEQTFAVVCAPQVTTLVATNLVVGSDGCVFFRGTVNPGQLPTMAWLICMRHILESKS